MLFFKDVAISQRQKEGYRHVECAADIEHIKQGALHICDDAVLHSYIEDPVGKIGGENNQHKGRGGDHQKAEAFLLFQGAVPYNE